MKRWLIPSIAFFCVAIISLVFTLPYFSKGNRILDYKKKPFENRIIRDSQNITSAVTAHLATGNLAAIDGIMQTFFENEMPEHFGITGLAILDHNKKVISAYTSKTKDKPVDIIGSSYSGIKFKREEMSAHKILTLFHADKDNPMGTKGVEIAYEIRQDNGCT